jgi:lipopolysaccharide/colanic/teichoic acid biosynthesis glycosyltransferase
MAPGSIHEESNYEDTMGNDFVHAHAAELQFPRPIESEDNFLLRIAQECRRAERSRNRFVLVLVQGLQDLPASETNLITGKIARFTREIDTIGWYQTDMTIGILFVELGDATFEEASIRVIERIRGAMKNVATADQLEVSAHILPRDLNSQGASGGGPERVIRFLEPLSSPDKKINSAIKRAIDVLGSAAMLVLLSPVFAVIAIAIKLTSDGPVLFRQTRVGRRGRPFTFLKFRSMEVLNDSKIHEVYVKDFIRGQAAKNKNQKGEGVFKLTKDPRVTPIGAFLRKSSLDELPQFWNVLLGDMSLVGPRPPIPYEVECYDLWHQRRVLEVKPGITGLWQIAGRSRIGFNDMVRLDLQYARTWSPWLDLKILAKTPFVVIGDGGAH